jgi:hypothetical protein
MKPFGFSDRYVKWSFFSMVSAVLENKVWMMDRGGGFLYPTMYVLLVGGPGYYKTTTAERAVYDCLLPISTDAEGPWFGPSIASPAAMVHIFRANNSKNILNKFLSSPMFVYAGEFNTFYRDIGGGEMTIDLLNFFDPKPPGVAWKKSTVKDGDLEVISPALTILGCTTQKNIADSKMLQICGTGIISRFIFVVEPKKPKGDRTGYSIKGHPTLAKIQNRLRKIREMRGPLLTSPHAEGVINKLEDSVETWFTANPAETLYSSYMARRNTHVRKLAMILSVLDKNTGIIDVEDLEQADAFMSEIEKDIPTAFTPIVLKDDPNLMDKIFRRIPAEGITLSALLQVFVQDSQAVPLDNAFIGAVNGLVARGDIVQTSNAKTGIATYVRIKK